MKNNKKNLIGKMFGRLLVLGEAKERQHGHIMWECQCVCGNTTFVRGDSLRSYRTISCGCYSAEAASKRDHSMCGRKETHGRTVVSKKRDALYTVWQNMKQACSNPNHRGYRLAGSKGIKVCDRWLNSFENFLNDVGERPGKKKFIRINRDKDYESGNVMWW